MYKYPITLQNLVEGWERNMAQLERIGATMEQRWGLKGENRKEESGDKEKGSKDSPGNSQQEETLLFASC